MNKKLKERAIAQQTATKIIGMTIEGAREYCAYMQVDCRLVKANGKGLMCTADVKMNRVNITIEKAKKITHSDKTVSYTGGTVTKANIG